MDVLGHYVPKFSQPNEQKGKKEMTFLAKKSGDTSFLKTPAIHKVEPLNPSGGGVCKAGTL